MTAVQADSIRLSCKGAALRQSHKVLPEGKVESMTIDVGNDIQHAAKEVLEKSHHQTEDTRMRVLTPQGRMFVDVSSDVVADIARAMHAPAHSFHITFRGKTVQAGTTAVEIGIQPMDSASSSHDGKGGGGADKKGMKESESDSDDVSLDNVQPSPSHARSVPDTSEGQRMTVGMHQNLTGLPPGVADVISKNRPTVSPPALCTVNDPNITVDMAMASLDESTIEVTTALTFNTHKGMRSSAMMVSGTCAIGNLFSQRRHTSQRLAMQSMDQALIAMSKMFPSMQHDSEDPIKVRSQMPLPDIRSGFFTMSQRTLLNHSDETDDLQEALSDLAHGVISSDASNASRFTVCVEGIWRKTGYAHGPCHKRCSQGSEEAS